MPPLVRIWSDYVCPFCYVAMERAAWLEREYMAGIEWLPFDLHPEYPSEGIDIDVLSQRYGHDVNESQARMFAAAGLPNTRREFVPNSRGALNLAELARERGVHEELHPRLMNAYWAEGRDIGDTDVLLAEAEAVGLDAGEARDAIETHRYQGLIHASTQAVYEMGASGVPAFVVDDRMLIPGAQPHELFTKALGKLGYGGEVVDNVP